MRFPTAHFRPPTVRRCYESCSTHSPRDDAKVERTDGQETVLGDPTEAALIVAGEKAGMIKPLISLV